MLLSRKKFGMSVKNDNPANAIILQRLPCKVNQKETGSGMRAGPDAGRTLFLTRRSADDRHWPEQ